MRTKSHQQPKTSLIQDLRQLFSYVSHRRKIQLMLLLSLMILSSVSEMISLGAIFPFLDALSNSDRILGNLQAQVYLDFFKIDTSVELVTAMALTFSVITIVSNGIRILNITVQTHLAASIASDISCELYGKTLLQPYSFHSRSNSSDLIHTVTVDTQTLTLRILIPLLVLVTNSLVVLALTGGLILINPNIAIISGVALGGLYISLYRLRRKLLHRNGQIIVKNGQKQIKIVQESLGGIREVLVGGLQNFFQSGYRENDPPLRHAHASNMVISQNPRYITEAFAMTSIAILALSLGQGGDFSQAVPILGSLALGANRLLPALQQVYMSLAKIQGERTALKHILRGLQLTIDPWQNWIPNETLPLNNEILFQDIWFRYNSSEEWLFKNLNLKILANNTVGFVGSTGSGKSTTADLILGLLRPQKGSILVDGNKLIGQKMRQWQQSIAHVPQSIFLSDRTIVENIAFGIPETQINHEQVIHASKLARLDDFVQSLPEKYHTYVGERGIRLSGGQRQRIGIARALYRKASVIIFDEATSALDNITEKEVMEAINGLSHKFTIIIIAHRLGTVERCDQIIELNKGTIIAQGTYEELLKTSKSFQKMAMK
jgi:ATP-binding cassette, subfamily B, bacterial PglK